MHHQRSLLAPEPNLDMIETFEGGLPHFEDDPPDVSQPAENGIVVPGHRRIPVPGVQGVEDGVAALLVAQLVDPGEVFRVVVDAPAVGHGVVVGNQGHLPDLIDPILYALYTWDRDSTVARNHDAIFGG